jgi:hypothetical protein
MSGEFSVLDPDLNIVFIDDGACMECDNGTYVYTTFRFYWEDREDSIAFLLSEDAGLHWRVIRTPLAHRRFDQEVDQDCEPRWPFCKRIWEGGDFNFQAGLWNGNNSWAEDFVKQPDKHAVNWRPNFPPKFPNC